MPSSGALKAILLLFSLLPQTGSPPSDQTRIAETLERVRVKPGKSVQYDYAMTVRVRLLFFWVGKDDVGEGYIRHAIAKDDPREEMIQILFGSDPGKAPRNINRWGAGTEIQWHNSPIAELSVAPGGDVTSSAFFGFMKSSKGKSVSEMQAELKKEGQNGEHMFNGILSSVAAGRAVSTVAPLASNIDYNLHQYEQAESIMYDKLRILDHPIRVLAGKDSCERNRQFLGTVAELIDAALAGKSGNRPLCYVYDSKFNTLTLEHTEKVKTTEVKVRGVKGDSLIEKKYENLLAADFLSAEPATGKKTYFTILVGTEGDLRGVPVQIRYQPNWWFQIVLNLH